MTIHHHPPDVKLAAFAAGTLDLGQRVVIATHISGCAQCRAFVQAMTHVGGVVLDRLPPTPMADGSFAKLMARLDAKPAPPTVASPPPLDDVPELPEFVRRRGFERWKWIGPGVHLRPMSLPKSSATRVFLLKAAPGTRMLEHSHTQLEMTCVLAGGYSHAGGHFLPGDFDLGDDEIDHRPVVDAGEPCVCLVALQGELRLSGLLGRLIAPFVRL